MKVKINDRVPCFLFKLTWEEIICRNRRLFCVHEDFTLHMKYFCDVVFLYIRFSL